MDGRNLNETTSTLVGCVGTRCNKMETGAKSIKVCRRVQVKVPSIWLREESAIGHDGGFPCKPRWDNPSQSVGEEESPHNDVETHWPRHSYEDARELSCPEIPSIRKLFEKKFGGGKSKFLKRKFEAKKETEGGLRWKPNTPKGQLKRVKWVGAKDAIKKGLCFKCGSADHMARDCRECAKGGVKVEINVT